MIKPMLLALMTVAAAPTGAAVTTITFTEVNHAGALTDQYAAFGINFGLSGGIATTRTYTDVRDTFDMRGIAGTPQRGNPNIIFDAPVDDLSFDYLTIGKSFFIRAHGEDDATLEVLFVQAPSGVVTNAAAMFSADRIKRVQLLDIDQLVGISTLRFTVPGAAVPEPASWAMMIMGFGAVGTFARSARRVSAPSGAIA